MASVEFASIVEMSLEYPEENQDYLEATLAAQDADARSSKGYEHSKRQKNADGEAVSRPGEGFAKLVATHYNSLVAKGLDERSKSSIFHLRKFHNWIKSTLINEYLTKIKAAKTHNASVRVMDLCSGRGGDLLKWRKGNITHLVCSDIASMSLDHCKSRYADMEALNSAERIYTVEYIEGDCSKVSLRERFSDASMKLDLVSCQFALHYSFESLPQAECMLRNASECLQPGGFFLGTIPDANDLIARARKADSHSFGNDVYQVEFDCDVSKPPLFGAKYHFHLKGAIDCPEFLVHFPTLVKLASKYGLKLVAKDKFYHYYERMKDQGKELMTNMRSFDMYPPDNCSLVAKDDYVHMNFGTLSKAEWEASTLYMLFVFEKVEKHLE